MKKVLSYLIIFSFAAFVASSSSIYVTFSDLIELFSASCASANETSNLLLPSFSTQRQKNETLTLQFKVAEESGDNYSQSFYEEMDSSYLLGPQFDGSGTYYYINIVNNQSHVYRNYGASNSDRFLTISGKIDHFDVITSGGVSYVYYKLSDDTTTVYRRKLTRSGVAEAESCDFTFKNRIAIADNPERLLIVSKASNTSYTIGLFEWGKSVPIRTWTVKPYSDNDGAYRFCYEVSTKKLSFEVRKAVVKSGRSIFRYHYLHDFSSGGEMEEYKPEEDVPNWNEGYYKNLDTFRYGRILWEYIGEAEEVYSVSIYDPISKTIRTTVYTYKDNNGISHTLNDFLPVNADEGYTYDTYPDELKNVYIRYWGYTGKMKTLHFRSQYSVSTGNVNVVALERKKVKSSYNKFIEQDDAYKNDKYIIWSIEDNYYLNAPNTRIDEAFLAKLSADEYSKEGFTADGNTRLILRARASKPGTVIFSIPEGFGTLETLTRGKGTSDIQIAIKTTPVNDGIYQASAVLISPFDYPNPELLFPSQAFDVKLSFTGDDGTTQDLQPLQLKIRAVPVILIHGIWGEWSGTFNVGKAGIWNSLFGAYGGAYPNIAGWNYKNTNGPNDVIPEGTRSGLFYKIADILDAFNEKYNVACTRVDLVVHSMGGLMARRFVQTDEGNKNSALAYKQGLIRRILTVATPNEGSPLANYIMYNNFPLWTRPKTGIELVLPYRALELQIADILQSAVIRTYVDLTYKNILFSANNSISGLTDLALESTLVTALKNSKEKVPLHVIYGGIKDVNLNEIDELPAFISWIFEKVPLILYGGDAAKQALFRIIFGDDDYDIAVGASSAKSKFTGNMTEYKGWNYNHMNICGQNDVGQKVVLLLQGSLKDFDSTGIFSASEISPTFYVTDSNENEEEASYQYAITEAFTLTANNKNDKITIAPNTVVKFSATAKGKINNIVYLFVKDEKGSKLFKLADTGDGKTFETSITFAEYETGIFEANCVSQASDNEGYTSNTINLVIRPDLTNIQSLEFINGKVIRIEESSDINPDLFATTTDGGMFNVSAPDLGSEWEFDDPSVAQITPNGKILGLKAGFTSATVTVGTYKQTASIDVDVKTMTKPYPINPNEPEQPDNPKEDDSDNSKDEGNEKEVLHNRGGGGCNSEIGTGIFAFIIAMFTFFRRN